MAVTDGDTITVLDDGSVQQRIRLTGIDAPEHKQAFGDRAKRALSEKVFGEAVRVEWRERDKYGRIVGDVYVGDRHINLEMVREGWAWHFTQYSTDERLADAEQAARSIGAGLWADPDPVPPWQFRHAPTAARASGADDPVPERDTARRPGSRPGLAPPVNARYVEPSGPTVYVTKTGSKYHAAGCRHLPESAIPLPLEEAIRRGYGPCRHCH